MFALVPLTFFLSSSFSQPLCVSDQLRRLVPFLPLKPAIVSAIPPLLLLLPSDIHDKASRFLILYSGIAHWVVFRRSRSTSESRVTVVVVAGNYEDSTNKASRGWREDNWATPMQIRSTRTAGVATSSSLEHSLGVQYPVFFYRFSYPSDCLAILPPSYNFDPQSVFSTSARTTTSNATATADLHALYERRAARKAAVRPAARYLSVRETYAALNCL